MSRNILLNLALTPVFNHDIDADRYVMHYKEFPEAHAVGQTVEEAENNLIPLVELMWQEQPEYLAKKLLENYINNSHGTKPKLNIIKE
jgi:predicted RNase H-like HicB family nuclease